MSFLTQNLVFFCSFLIWQFRMKALQAVRMTTKMVSEIDQESMKNGPKMGLKLDLFSNGFGGGCRLRFWSDLERFWGPCCDDFGAKNRYRSVLKKHPKNDWSVAILAQAILAQTSLAQEVQLVGFAWRHRLHAVAGMIFDQLAIDRCD